MRHPDNPQLGDLSLLARLDAEPPGTWIGQPKKNGHRLLSAFDPASGWAWHTKTAGMAERFPADLREEWREFWKFLAYSIVIDSEWVGPRGGVQNVWVLDLLAVKGQWFSLEPQFRARYAVLAKLYDVGLAGRRPGRIRLMPAYENPGLVTLFHEQLADPESEGVVIRRADSGLRLGSSRCLDNPYWFKVKFQVVNRVLRHIEKEG